MKFNKSKVRQLNELLQEVKENRDQVIDLISELCPGSFEECDAQVQSSREAINCPYFVLCNVMGSYSLISEDERQEADEFLDNLYKTIKFKKKGFLGIYL